MRKHLIVPVFAVVVLIATITAGVWHHSSKLSAGTAAMPSLQELHAGAAANKLPNQEIEDQSLVFPNIAKR
jgi:hypothetical protein